MIVRTVDRWFFTVMWVAFIAYLILVELVR